MKKHDLIIIAAAAVIALAALFAFPAERGDTVTVQKDNKTVYTGSILTDKTLDLGSNVLVIKNGEVYMKNANCKNGVCVHTGKISKKGESIICLPNRIIARIE